jgi:hypothetical protein
MSWTMKNLHHEKNLEMQLLWISWLVFGLNIKQKSGIPFLPLLTFPEIFNSICPKKVVHRFNGLKVLSSEN